MEARNIGESEAIVCLGITSRERAPGRFLRVERKIPYDLEPTSSTALVALRARPSWEREEKEEKDEGRRRRRRRGEEWRGEIGEIYSVRGISRSERTRERRIATKSQGAWALCQGAVPEKKKRVLGRERQGSLFSLCCSFRGLRRDNPQLVLAKSRVYGLIE